MLTKKIIMVVLLSLISGTLMAQEVKVTSLMSKVMADVSGKRGSPWKSSMVCAQACSAQKFPRAS